MSQDIIKEIEKQMDKIGNEYDSYGQALAHEKAVQTLLPLLRKALEQRDEHNDIDSATWIEQDNKELLKLLEGK